MNCPKCQSAMATVKIGIVEVDRCTNCGGLWFDSLEEEWLKTPGDAVALDVGDAQMGSALNANDRIDCPRCQHPHGSHGRRRTTPHLVRVVQGLLRPLLRRRGVPRPGKPRHRGSRAPLAGRRADVTTGSPHARRVVRHLALAALLSAPVTLRAQTIVPVEQEPVHKVVFENDLVRVIDAALPVGHATPITHTPGTTSPSRWRVAAWRRCCSEASLSNWR